MFMEKEFANIGTLLTKTNYSSTDKGKGKVVPVL